MVIKTLKAILKERSSYPKDSSKAWHQEGVLLEVTQDYGNKLASEGLAEIVQEDGALETKAPDFKKTGAQDKDQAAANEAKPKRKRKNAAS